MKQLFLGLIVIVFGACNEVEKKPDYLLEKIKFVEVLTDFETAEAIVRLGYNRTKDSLIYNDSIYSSVFRKHQITEAIFDSNFTYYSNKPEEFELIYEEVITNLSKRSAELQEKIKELPDNPK